MAIVHLFCNIFKFTFNRKFFLWKRMFWNFFYLSIFFFIKQKILQRTPYQQKVRDPTFLRPKFDVTPSIYNFKKKILLLPPLLTPCVSLLSLAILSNSCQKKIEHTFQPFLKSFLSKSVYFYLIFLLQTLHLILIHQ